MKRLSLIAEIPDESAEAAEIFCAEAALELEGRLKSPEFAEDLRVIAAAAHIAAAKLSSVFGEAENVKSFKAGDISVVCGEAKYDCAADEALKAASPCLKDIEFYFRGV